MAKTNNTTKEVKNKISLNLIKYSPVPKQMTIQTVVDNLASGCYAVDPFFQREYVWENTDESYMIESIILGYSLPTLFGYEQMQEGRCRLFFSDGQQRLTAIYRFIMGTGKSEKTGKILGQYALRGLKKLPELNGKNWNDLGNMKFIDEDGNEIDLQYRIKNYALDMSVFPQGTPIEIVQDHYTRLNTSGANLSWAAQRRNMYFGIHYSFLRTIANDTNFLEILGNKGCGKEKKKQTHESYVQLWSWLYLNRVFKNNSVHYSDNPNSPNKAVDKHMQEFKDNPNKFTDEMREEMTAAFSKTVRIIKNLFGNKAFKKPTIDETTSPWSYKMKDGDIEFGPMNEGFYECLMYLFSFADENSVMSNSDGIVNAIYAEVKNNRKFYESVNKRVRTKKSAAIRFPHFYTILKDQGVKFEGLE